MFGDWISKWVQAWGDGNGGMLGRGFRHELLLLRFLGKVPKCGETNSFAPVIVHPRVENCWDRQMQSAATIMSPSERQVVQRLSRSLFGSFADPRSSLTSRTKLGQHELGLKKTLVRFMATDHENSSIPQEGLSAKVGGNASEADDSSPVVQNLAAMTEDASAADANSSQVGDQVMPDKSHAEPGDPSATEVLQEKVDELTVEQTLILAEDSGGVSHTTPEDLLSNLDDTDEGLKRLDTLAPALSKAMEEFQQGRGHPAKVYVHIKSFEKIRTGQLRNVRSAGLPVKRSLFTVNRSPHVDKKARDQFDMKVHKHLLIIETETHRLHQKLTELKNHDLPGVQLKVTFQYETRLDKSLLA